VDDDVDLTDVMALVLKSVGHEVRAARSVEEGLAACAEGVDLVLVDLMLPEPYDGYAFVHRLRTEVPEPARGVPIVLLSALTSAQMGDLTYPAVEGALFPAGEPVPISAYAEKPLAPAQLLSLVNHILGQTVQDPRRRDDIPSARA